MSGIRVTEQCTDLPKVVWSSRMIMLDCAWLCIILYRDRTARRRDVDCAGRQPAAEEPYVSNGSVRLLRARRPFGG